jgi:uncharacterized protein YgfB (UPF0149 family)
MTVQSNIEQAFSGLRSPTYVRRGTNSYYVVMIDYGNGPAKPMGLEAVVQPERTRRDIVEMLAHGEFKHGLYIEDVTDELFDEAEAICRQQAAE